MKPEQTAKKYSGGTPERPWRSSVSDESSIEKPEQNKRPISKYVEFILSVYKNCFAI